MAFGEIAAPGRGEPGSCSYLQVDRSEWYQLRVDLVPTVMAAAGPLLWLPTALAGWRNIPNLSQREVVTILAGHPVFTSSATTSPTTFSQPGIATYLRDVGHVAVAAADEVRHGREEVFALRLLRLFNLHICWGGVRLRRQLGYRCRRVALQNVGKCRVTGVLVQVKASRKGI